MSDKQIWKSNCEYIKSYRHIICVKGGNMKELKFNIKDPNGIHARPAGILVKSLKGYKSKVTIFKGEKSADMKKLLAVMGLGIKQGDDVIVKVDGEDEETCAAELVKAFEENF